MSELARPQKSRGASYFDLYQKIIVGFIAGTSMMFFVLIIARLYFLDNLPIRGIVDNFQAVNMALHFGAWVWFILRSVTFSMRQKEARKEEKDI